MALRTPPSWLQNGSHPAENDRLTTKAIWQTTGIVNPTDLQITQNGGGNMSVNVSSGWAAIVGTTQVNMGTYMAYNDASTNLTITTASPSNPRIDLVVITINDAYYTGSLNNVSFQVIAGTPAASPTVPATPANSLALGQIAVGTSVTSILTANITNYGVQATGPFGNVTTTGTQTLTNKTLNLTPTAGTSATTGVLNVGTNSFSDTGLLATFQSSIAGYNQVTVQNTSNNAAASAELIVYNDQGTASTNYASMGINSSTYTGTGALNAAGAGFYATGSTDMAIGTFGANSLHIVTNSGATDAMTVNPYNTTTHKSPKELVTVSATAATGTVNFDVITQGILYYTTAASANWTLNFRGNGSVTLNTLMNTGDAQSVIFLNTNGGTAYYPTAFTIDGTSVTPKWSGGTAPTTGNASAIDAWTFTIIKTGSAAYTVLAGGATKFA
jgi:hypothetical protein